MKNGTTKLGLTCIFLSCALLLLNCAIQEPAEQDTKQSNTDTSQAEPEKSSVTLDQVTTILEAVKPTAPAYLIVTDNMTLLALTDTRGQHYQTLDFSTKREINLLQEAIDTKKTETLVEINFTSWGQTDTQKAKKASFFRCKYPKFKIQTDGPSQKKQLDEKTLRPSEVIGLCIYYTSQILLKDDTN